MARLYKVSADTSEKEKIVGGIMTINQAGWIVLGLLISAAIFALLYKWLGPAVALIICAIPGLTFGGIFAFYKKEQLPLATYLIYKRNFKKKSKRLVNDMVYGKVFMSEEELFL